MKIGVKPFGLPGPRKQNPRHIAKLIISKSPGISETGIDLDIALRGVNLRATLTLEINSLIFFWLGKELFFSLLDNVTS